MSTLVRVCSVDDVAPESAIPVEVPRGTAAGSSWPSCTATGPSTPSTDECSHAQIPLSEGDVGDGEIECYLHGSRFDLRTGEPIGLPATEPVPIYRCIVEGNDVLVDVSAPLDPTDADPTATPTYAQEF